MAACRRATYRPARLGALAFLLALGLVGCAAQTRPEIAHERVASVRYDTPADTRLGRALGYPETAQRTESGFQILATGRDAFEARVRLAALAEHAIDAQYYIWARDESGFMLGDALLHAADRGVRVRILIDDMYTGGRDVPLASFDAHPNIELRVFNPFTARSNRAFNFLGSMKRLDHRMHNKLFVADGAAAIVGGRNIGNDYFGVDSAKNYRDLDTLAVGPIVPALAASFDDYWNCDWAIPISALEDKPAPEAFMADVVQARTRLEIQEFPYPITFTESDLDEWATTLHDELAYGEAEVLVDKPNKPATDSTTIHDRFRELQDAAEHHLTIENAYVVPDERTYTALTNAHAQGLHYRLLTNSAASNDVGIVHAHYARSRKRMLGLGVELYELRVDAEDVRRHWSLLAGRSQASLHTKVFTADNAISFIGSYNADPRSRDINTEIGVLVRSEELAKRLDAYMDDGMQLDNSYRVELDADGNIVWVTKIEGKEIRFTREPHTSPWTRFTLWFLGRLPVKDKL